jgi:protein TonB
MNRFSLMALAALVSAAPAAAVAQMPATPIRVIPIPSPLPPLSGRTYVVSLQWVKAPGPADLVALYPEQAKAAGVSGRSVVDCELAADGSLAGCLLRTETPVGYGFGDAALQAVRAFQAAPTSRSGASVAGNRIMLALSWPPTETQPTVYQVNTGYSGPVQVVTVAPPPPPPTPHGPPIVKPDWERMPNAEDLGALYPDAAWAQKLVGKTITQCIATARGTLATCAILSESPKGYGFGRASLQATRYFKMRPIGPDGSVEGRPVDIPLVWIPPATQPPPTIQLPPAKVDTPRYYQPVMPVTVAPPPPPTIQLPPAKPSGLHDGPVATQTPPVPPRPSIISSPDWERVPNGEDLLAVYPDAARDQHASGHSRMQCKVTARGTLTDCQILDEDPKGMGFGRASLQAAKFFKMRPRTVDGAPVEGATVIIPIGWRFPAS